MKARVTLFHKPILACAIATLSLTALAGAPDALADGNKRMPMRVDQSGPDKEARKADRAEHHRWLLSQRVPAASRNPLVLAASADELAAVDEAPKQSPQLVGFSQDLAFDVAFADIKTAGLRHRAQALKYGAVERTAKGGYAYTAELSSPGAFGIRVQFKGFNLPPGAALYLYTHDGQVYGPYTGRGPNGNGQFDSNTVIGDTALLQLTVTDSAGERGLKQSKFQVAGLGHIRPRMLAGTCSDNADCVVNASCVSTGPAAAAEDAVALMVYRSGGGYYICSGGLIDNAAGDPLFLTANHCVSRGREASSLETFFQFTTPCGSSDGCNWTLSNLPNTPRVTGSTILSTGRDQDYTLLRLSQSPNFSGVTYLGWNATPVAFTNGLDLFRISHPAGSPQSYSRHDVSTTAGQCTAWPRGDRIYSRDATGATEGGSSGSPVLNSAGEIVGQLSGACGTNLNDNCDAVNNATVDGAFAAYFGQVEQFLDPDPGSCTPSTEICDGEDNDCDGQVDEGDVCGGGGGLPSGAACNVNSDCASNNCKGKPGEKTCK